MILGFNGSPRTSWSTAQLVKRALDGAASVGAQTEYFDLTNLNFKGCQSCFLCKRGSKFEGKCYFQDELTPVLDKLKKCDGFVIGFPIYMGLPSSLSHVFLERAIYSNCVYRQELTVYGKTIKTGLIVSSGAKADAVRTRYGAVLTHLTGIVGSIFGSCEWIGHHNAQDVGDYSVYDMEFRGPDERIRHRKEQFPVDLRSAYELGRRIATRE
jgi:multimeric flavodoxin WrbA